jgi:hypothetical protein
MPDTKIVPAGRPAPPYVTAWSSEPYLTDRLIERGNRLAYAHESPDDRDEHGVLWYRAPFRQGHGRPDFVRVHPQRQRKAMSRLLCQVCAGPADRTPDGLLWLLIPDHDEDWVDWPETMPAPEPPVCRPCARRALKQCPALRQSVTIVRVRDCPIVGVRGTLHQPAWPAPEPIQEVLMRFGNPLIRWVRAAGLLRELHGCTVLTAADLTVTTGE